MMRKRVIKAVSFTVLAVLMLSLLMASAWAAETKTLTYSVAPGVTSVSIPFEADGGSKPYGGIEFGVTIESGSTLKFVSFSPSAAIFDKARKGNPDEPMGATSSARIIGENKDPETEDDDPPIIDGVQYFGFYADDNVYSGTFSVGTLNFSDYKGEAPVRVTISYMEVTRFEGQKTTSLRNSEDVYVITIQRASDNTPPPPPPAVVDIPDPETPTTGDDDEGYLDVDYEKPDWFAEAVTYVTEKGLMNGTGGNKFSPNIPVTRAMFVTLLGRLAEQLGEETTGFNNPFNDVPAGQWYTPFVAWGADKDIVQGHSATRFAPNDPVTREQMAALLVRFCEYKKIALKSDTGVTFSDAGDVSAWAKAAVERAAAAGLMQGSNGRFRPKATATRAEAAQLLMNFVRAYLEDDLSS